MKKKAILAGAVFLLHLSGCAMHTPSPRTFSCDKPKCEIEVTVKVSGSECIPEVAYTEIRVPRSSPNSKLEWTLATGDYTFPSSSQSPVPGIFIKGPLIGEFEPEASGSNKKYVLKNKRQQRVTTSYNYGVVVYDEKNKALCKILDPVIVNEM